MSAIRGIFGWSLRSAAIVHLSCLVFLLFWAVLPLGFSHGRAAVIVSGSMMPVIQPGDLVVFDRPDTDTLGPGDVVLVDDPADPGHLLTHRLVKQRPDGQFITQGDANSDADSTPVPIERILGRGRLVIPFVGRAMLWQTKEGQIWAGALAISLLIVTRDLLALGSPRRYTPRHAAWLLPQPVAPATVVVPA